MYVARAGITKRLLSYNIVLHLSFRLSFHGTGSSTLLRRDAYNLGAFARAGWAFALGLPRHQAYSCSVVWCQARWPRPQTSASTKEKEQHANPIRHTIAITRARPLKYCCYKHPWQLHFPNTFGPLIQICILCVSKAVRIDQVGENIFGYIFIVLYSFLSYIHTWTDIYIYICYSPKVWNTTLRSKLERHSKSIVVSE